MLAVAEVAATGAVAEPTAAALSQFEDLGLAALSQCGAGESPEAIEVTAIAAGIVAMVSVQLRWAPLRSEPLRPGPTAAAATTPTATTFAPAGTVRTELAAAASCQRLWRVRFPQPLRTDY
jgi:predicted metal-dependent phosphotriesterase family hydrolase